MTGLRGGVRVPKDDIRIEANGALDELNAVIGIVRSMLDAGHRWQPLLKSVQEELMVIMSHIATPEGKENPRTMHAVELTSRMEEEIDRVLQKRQLPDRDIDSSHNETQPAQSGFVLPGGSPLTAHLHFARTVCRRAERRLWSLHRVYPQDEAMMRFINRLSDLFFTMATD